MSFTVKKIFYTHLYKLLLVISNRFNNQYISKYKLLIGSTLIFLIASCQKSEKKNNTKKQVLITKTTTEKQETSIIDYVIEEIKERPRKRQNKKSNDKAIEIIEYVLPVEMVEEEIENDIMCYVVIENMAEYPGGRSNLLKYFNTHINYPSYCLANNIEGKVIVQFTVNNVGEINTTTVIKSVSPELDAEVLKAVCEMPRWKPAAIHGRNISMNFTLPVSFKINHR